jgi:S1-C subfamily serine protease
VDLNAVYLKLVDSVFLIETPVRRGSGWLIEPGLILTVQHVVAGASNVTVRQAANPPFTATVLAVDSRKDIALLRFDPARAQLSLRTAPLPLGLISTRDIARSLLALGYSGSGVKEDGTVGGAAANVGVLSQFIDFGSQGLGLNLVMDAPTDPGDSGGPVLDGDGLVVGMVRAVAVGQRVLGTFYAVHVDEIRAALPSLRQGISR